MAKKRSYYIYLALAAISGLIIAWNFGGFLALIPAYIGAYAGYFAKRFVSS